MSREAALSPRTRRAQDKARVLREALPWIRRWTGRTLVVKLGGNALGGGPHAARVLDSFSADVALLHSVGLRVVVVHGGGPQIDALAARLGLDTRFVDGRRVTDAATLDAVRMVLMGQVNPAIVAALAAHDAPAVGVAGTDAGMVTAAPKDPALGLVGEVTDVDPSLLVDLLDSGRVPVVATLCRGSDGETYNVNADTVAGAVAGALPADKLIELTDVPGLYEDFGTDEETLLSEVGAVRLRELLESGALHAGMVPKVAAVVAALDAGVPQAHLLDGRVEHALLLEIFTDEGVGTMVTGDPP